jgi:hypothetical protein
LTISFAVSVLYPFLSEKNKIKRIQKTIIKHEHAIFLLKNLKANCHGSNDKLIDALREQYLILAGISYETKNPPMIASQFGVSLLR